MKGLERDLERDGRRNKNGACAWWLALFPSPPWNRERDLGRGAGEELAGRETGHLGIWESKVERKAAKGEGRIRFPWTCPCAYQEIQGGSWTIPCSMTDDDQTNKTLASQQKQRGSSSFRFLCQFCSPVLLVGHTNIILHHHAPWS
jgi:hypothetical protein